MGENDIFPLMDRETPVLDRVRKRRNNGDGKSEDLTVAGAVSDSLLEDDVSDLHQRLTDRLGQEIAGELGVPLEGLDRSRVEQISESVVNIEMDELLTDDALEELGYVPKDRGLEELGKEQEEMAEQDDGEEEEGESDKF